MQLRPTQQAMKVGSRSSPSPWIPAPYRSTGQAVRGNDGWAALGGLFSEGMTGKFGVSRYRSLLANY